MLITTFLGLTQVNAIICLGGAFQDNQLFSCMMGSQRRRDGDKRCVGSKLQNPNETREGYMLYPGASE
jgi:hypothetical protein